MMTPWILRWSPGRCQDHMHEPHSTIIRLHHVLGDIAPDQEPALTSSHLQNSDVTFTGIITGLVWIGQIFERPRPACRRGRSCRGYVGYLAGAMPDACQYDARCIFGICLGHVGPVPGVCPGYVVRMNGPGTWGDGVGSRWVVHSSLYQQPGVCPENQRVHSSPRTTTNPTHPSELPRSLWSTPGVSPKQQ